MAKLYANEKNKTRAWSDGSNLMAMQESGKPPPAKPDAKASAPKPELAHSAHGASAGNGETAT
jgi:hypothetical protein